MNSEKPAPQGQLQTVLKHDVMSSVVVFLIALPLCMGISIASGVPVAAGLITGIVGGLIVATFSGAPLQVSGPAAGLAVVNYEIVREHGLETLGLVVLLGGLIQLVSGIFKLGQWFRAVSPAVIKGMLAGIGVLIFASQFHVMVDDSPKGSGIEDLMSLPQAVQKGMPWPNLGSEEQRETRTELLREFGTLHNWQVEIREEVGEIVPELSSGELTEAEREELAALAVRQEQLNDRLEELTGRLDVGAATKSEESAQALQATTEEAKSAAAAALADLKNFNVSSVRESQAEIEHSILAVENGLKNHDIAAKIGLLTIVIIVLWKLAIPKKWQIVPAPLVAVVAATAVCAVFVLPVLYVEVPPQLLDDLHMPRPAVFFEGDTMALLLAGVVVALVASAETLLCATAVDQMHDGQRTQYNRELCAQGAGNMICGLLGALPMTGVIVRSATNVQAGAKTRWSAFLHGFWLLVFVVFLTGLIRMIPITALAAMLVYTGYKLVDIGSIRRLAEYGKGEVLIYFATVGMIVGTDLLTGVLTGIALSAAKLLFTVSRLKIDVTEEKDRKVTTVHLHGTATFLQLPILAEKLEGLPRGRRIHIVEENLLFIDHACLDLIMNWAKQYCAVGGEVQVALEELRTRCRHPVLNGNGRENGQPGEVREMVAAETVS